MTVENSTLNCALKGNPGEPYWKSWALYFSKFLTAYEKEGISFFAVTVQNEPIKQALAPRAWQSLRFNSSTENDFIKLDLGPTLAKTHPNVGIIALDDAKDNLDTWNDAIEDPETRNYLLGTGVHWYR